jgi:GntR family transcriptional regulator/MocR family aminotransferase
VRRRNAERQQALLGALRRRFGDRIRIDGAAAGLHVVAWIDDLPQKREDTLIKAARAKGVGIYPVSALFDSRSTGNRRTRMTVGLVMGYSALEIAQIERGCRLLAQAIDELD